MLIQQGQRLCPDQLIPQPSFLFGPACQKIVKKALVDKLRG
jgi:hypothetical protein